MNRQTLDRMDWAGILFSSVAGAAIEDAASLGVKPDRLARRKLDGSPGIPLPGSLAEVATRVFGSDMGGIRLHTGPRADAFLHPYGRPAGCVGNRVVLSSWALGDRSRMAAMVAHELAHLAAGRREDVLRTWDADIHAALTAEACTACRASIEPITNAVGLLWPAFLPGIMNASSNMDVRQRLRHPVDTGTYLGKIVKGEGARHGEAFNYTVPILTTNKAKNEIEQNEHARIAAREIVRDDPLFTFQGRSYRFRSFRLIPGVLTGLPAEARRFGGITLMEREWVKSLANSLHVAQDRGSHREGTQGYGHDDPRDCHMVSGRKWSCDEKVHEHGAGRDWLHCSMAAYNVAFNNSIAALRSFLLELSRLVGATFPPPPVPLRSDSC